MADAKSNNATIKQALLLYQQHLLFQHHVQESYMPKNGKLSATPQDLARDEAYRKEMQTVTALLSSDQIIPHKKIGYETPSAPNGSPQPDTEPYLNPLTGLWVFPETPYTPGPSGATSISDGWGLVGATESVTNLAVAAPVKDPPPRGLDGIAGAGSAPDDFRPTRHQSKESKSSSVKRKPAPTSPPLQLAPIDVTDKARPPTRPPPPPPAPAQVANPVTARQNAPGFSPPSTLDAWPPTLQHVEPLMAQKAGPVELSPNPILMPPYRIFPPVLQAGRPDEAHINQSRPLLSPVDSGRPRSGSSVPSASPHHQTSRQASIQSATSTHVMSGAQGSPPPVSNSATEDENFYSDYVLAERHQKSTSHLSEIASPYNHQQQTFDATSAPPEPRFREPSSFSATGLRAFGQPVKSIPSPMLQQPHDLKIRGPGAAHGANASVSSFHLDNRQQPMRAPDFRNPGPPTILPTPPVGPFDVPDQPWLQNPDLAQGNGTHSPALQTSLQPSYENVQHTTRVAPDFSSQDRAQPTGPNLRPFGVPTVNLGGYSPSIEASRGAVNPSGLSTRSISPFVASEGMANTTHRLAQTKALVDPSVRQDGPTASSLRPSGFAPLSSTGTGPALQNTPSPKPAAWISSAGGLTPNTLRAFASIPKDASQIPSFAPLGVPDDHSRSSHVRGHDDENLRLSGLRAPEPRSQHSGAPKQAALPKLAAVSHIANHSSSTFHTGMGQAPQLSHDEMANLQRLQDEFNIQDETALAEQEAFARRLQAELDAQSDSDGVHYRANEHQFGSRTMPGSWHHDAHAGQGSQRRDFSPWQQLGPDSSDDDEPRFAPAVGVDSTIQSNLVIKPSTIARAPSSRKPNPQSPISANEAARQTNNKPSAEAASSAADEIARYEAAHRAQENAAAEAARAKLFASQAAARANSASKKVECTACSDKDSASAMAQLPCNHSYCSICIADAFKHAFTAGKVFICCNKTPCPVEVAERFLPADFVTLYKSKMEERMATNLVYCAKPGCAAFIPASNLKGPLATCPKCGFVSCSLCKNPEHKGICPPDSMGLKLMDLAGNKNWVQCTRCKAIVERDEGCLHMTCTCGYEFCYSCGGRWDQCGSNCPRKS